MRIAYVYRELASSRLTGPGARAFSTASAMAWAGHDVHLVSESLSAPRARALAAGHGRNRAQWTRVRETRPQHRYFTERHAYADRVYDTLRRLSFEEPFDVIEFGAGSGEGSTTIKSKRLLGEFGTTALLVRIDDEGDQTTRATDFRSFEKSVDAFARRYVAEHADARIADADLAAADLAGADLAGADLAGAGIAATSAPVTVAAVAAVPLGVPALRIPEVGAALTVWHLGELTPSSGIDSFLAAAALVLDARPDARFILAGDDTLTDPFGRSYWASLQRRLSLPLRAAVTFAGPLLDARQLLPQPGQQCVVATSSTDAAGCVLLAMARGCVVTVRDGTCAAAFVERDVNAAVVPRDDANALAASVLDVLARPDHAAALSRAATAHAFEECQPAQVAATLESVYRSVRGPLVPAEMVPWSRSADVVSVVIPLFNQGHYVAGAIDSIHASAYPHIEIVVVDDGSTDPETIEIFDNLRGVTKVRQCNAGLSAARNAGIEAASGRYIVPLDADDELPASFISAAVDAMRREPTLGYVAGYLRYFGLLDYTHVPVGYIPHVSLVVNTHVRATALFERSAIMAIGGYDTDLPAYEDWDLHIRLALAGYRSDIMPIECHRYRRHAESMTFSSSNAMRVELLQHLMTKHLADLGEPAKAELLLVMAHLWKTGFEPSASVKLQAESVQTLTLPDDAAVDLRAD